MDRRKYASPSAVPFGTMLREISGQKYGSGALAEVVSDVVGAVVAAEVTVVGPVTKEAVIRPDDWIVELRKTLSVRKAADLYLRRSFESVAMQLAERLSSFDDKAKLLAVQFSKAGQTLADIEVGGLDKVDGAKLGEHTRRRIDNIFQAHICEPLSARLSAIEKDLERVSGLPTDTLKEAINIVGEIEEKLRASAQKMKASSRREVREIQRHLDEVQSMASLPADLGLAVQTLLFLNSSMRVVDKQG